MAGSRSYTAAATHKPRPCKAVIGALGNAGSNDALVGIAQKGGDMAAAVFNTVWKASDLSAAEAFVRASGASTAENFAGWINANQGAAEVVRMYDKLPYADEGSQALCGWVYRNLRD